MRKPLVVYHGPTCADGLAAAWCFWHSYKDAVEYKVGVYQTEMDYEVFKDRVVYLVDFLYPPEVLYEITKYASNIVVLDHHENAIQSIFKFYENSSWPENLDMTGCDTRYSGAMLAWQYLSKTNPPTFIHYIQDRDLWAWKFAETKAFSRGLFSEPLTFHTLDRCYCDEQFRTELITKGTILIEEADKRIERTIENSVRYVNVHKYIIPVINCPIDLTSELGNVLAEESPFAVMYFDMHEKRNFSLRSSKTNQAAADVSEIARIFGGNGHKNAAGFKRSLDEPVTETIAKITPYFQSKEGLL